jgi:transcriptional regulator with XRE-family HTH domain
MKTGDIFCKNLREIRTRQDFTQKSLALQIGLNDQAIRDYEAGRRFPPVETLGQIADALGVKVSDLFESDNPAQELQLPVSKTLQKLMAIPDKVYDFAQDEAIDDEVWEIIEDIMEGAIEDRKLLKLPDLNKG